MYRMILIAIATVFVLGSGAVADPWKDESGHGKWSRGWGEFKQEWNGEHGGEAPWWARGKGYWDGHFKHHWGGPPPWAGRPHRYDGDPGPLPGYHPDLYYRGHWRVQPRYSAPPPYNRMPPPPPYYNYRSWGY